MLKVYKFAAAMILSAIALTMAAPQASAQTTEEPEVPADTLPGHSPSGVVNAFDFPEGMNTFRINGEYSINRSFKGGVSLYRGDELIRIIPASNMERLATWVDAGEGGSRADYGYVLVQFWDKTTDPASANGTYRVKVPEGIFFTNREQTTTNPEWEFTVKVAGSSHSEVKLEPADMSSLSRLDKIVLTLPDLENYRWYTNTTHSIYIEESFGDIANNNCTFEYDGNKCIITPSTPITTTGIYYLHIPSAFYLYKDGDGNFVGASSSRVTYYIAPDMSAGVTVTPDNKEPLMYLPGKIVEGVNRYVYFTLTLPEPVVYTLMEKPKFYELDENGMIGKEPVQQFYIVKDPQDSKTIYITSFDFVDPSNPEAGDLMLPEGKYSLVIPRNAYYVNVTKEDETTSMEPNAEYCINYTVGFNDRFPMIIYPEDGETLNNIEFISITFDEGNEITLKGNAYAHLSNGITEYALVGKVTEDLPNEVRFELPYPLTEAGEWSFSTPAGKFYINGNATSATAKYTVDPNAIVLDRTLTVEPGEGELESLQVFKIRFNAYPKATEYGQVGGSISLTKDGEELTIPVKYWSVDDSCLLLDMETPLTEAGTYVLTIESNTISAITEDGHNVLNKEAKFTYTIKEAEPEQPVEIAKPAITPADGKMTSTQEFVLTLPEGEKITEVKGEARLYQKDERSTEWVYNAVKTTDNTITLTLAEGQPEIVAGNYQLVTPAELFKTETGVAVEYVYDFECITDTVEGVVVDNAPADVYNAAGICVLRNADEEAVRTLDKGLYIYKGRKLIIK